MTVKKIDLVFRTIGERTSDIALDLALRHIQPHTVHHIENIRPFSHAVQTMLQIDYHCDYVVFMDADCLILEDLSPFLQQTSYLYVDSFVLDRFRGHVHQGVHITHIDVVREMQNIAIPQQDEKYVLRPESRLRSLALKKLKSEKHFKHFRIFHDFFQSYNNIFAKLCLRELRSRSPEYLAQLEAARKYWQRFPEEPDFQVANAAIDFIRKQVPPTADAQTLEYYITKLPEFAAQEVPKLHLPPQSPLTFAEVEAQAKRQWSWQLYQSADFYPSTASIHSTPSTEEQLITPRSFQHNGHHPSPGTMTVTSPRKGKVFGIGLSRTGTKSLTSALNLLGINVVHYPDDDTTLRELVEGNYNFSLLQHFDGITDITVAPFYPQLDTLFPGSKFILTVRNKTEWLQSLEKHWQGRPAFGDETFLGDSHNDSHNPIHMNIRRLLRAATYGCYEFNAHRMSYVYDAHYEGVLRYFEHRPEDLLVLDICGGDGWEKLCPFLNIPLVSSLFPYIKKQSVLQAFQSTPLSPIPSEAESMLVN
jgi:hypothetical protein